MEAGIETDGNRYSVREEATKLGVGERKGKLRKKQRKPECVQELAVSCQQICLWTYSVAGTLQPC